MLVRKKVFLKKLTGPCWAHSLYAIITCYKVVTANYNQQLLQSSLRSKVLEARAVAYAVDLDKNNNSPTLNTMLLSSFKHEEIMVILLITIRKKILRVNTTASLFSFWCRVRFLVFLRLHEDRFSLTFAQFIFPFWLFPKIERFMTYENENNESNARVLFRSG